METSPLSHRTTFDRSTSPERIEFLPRGIRVEQLHTHVFGSGELISRLGAIVWEADPLDFRTIFVSRQAEDVLGYPLRDWHDDVSFFERKLSPGDGRETIARLRQAVSAGGDHVLELRMVASDGSPVALRVFLHSVRDWQGRPRSLHGIMIGSGSQRSETRLDGVDASPKVPSSKASASRPSGRGGLPPLRPELPVQSSVDLNRQLRLLEPVLRSELGCAIVLRLSLEAGFTAVRVEPASLERVLLCLIRYARRSMLQGGELTIATSISESEDGTAALLMTIADTGLGLDAVRRAGVFASLFDRRPPEREANGLLEQVEELVASAGGSLSVSGEPHGGTRFEIALPIS